MAFLHYDSKWDNYDYVERKYTNLNLDKPRVLSLTAYNNQVIEWNYKKKKKSIWSYWSKNTNSDMNLHKKSQKIHINFHHNSALWDSKPIFQYTCFL